MDFAHYPLSHPVNQIIGDIHHNVPTPDQRISPLSPIIAGFTFFSVLKSWLLKEFLSFAKIDI